MKALILGFLIGIVISPFMRAAYGVYPSWEFQYWGLYAVVYAPVVTVLFFIKALLAARKA